MTTCFNVTVDRRALEAIIEELIALIDSADANASVKAVKVERDAEG